ncbi:CapA family protein [Streptomyces yatensis]|uniref:CapA family protein n=1 Tax=Streptomyces yatensis TaxID=155177 RepID=UPI003CD0882D
MDVVSPATDHALDHGIEGLLSTISALDQAGGRDAGAGTRSTRPTPGRAHAHRGRRRGVVIETAEGTRPAVQSFCSTLPPGANATSTRPGIAPIRIAQSLVLDGTTPAPIGAGRAAARADHPRRGRRAADRRAEGRGPGPGPGLALAERYSREIGPSFRIQPNGMTLFGDACRDRGRTGPLHLVLVLGALL